MSDADIESPSLEMTEIEHLRDLIGREKQKDEADDRRDERIALLETQVVQLSEKVAADHEHLVRMVEGLMAEHTKRYGAERHLHHSMGRSGDRGSLPSGGDLHA